LKRCNTRGEAKPSFIIYDQKGERKKVFGAVGTVPWEERTELGSGDLFSHRYCQFGYKNQHPLKMRLPNGPAGDGSKGLDAVKERSGTYPCVGTVGDLLRRG
jgi:hypothetical protein